MLHRREPWIIAVVAVQSSKPEQLVAAKLTAQPNPPNRFVVRWCVGLRLPAWTVIKDRDGKRRPRRIICKSRRRGLLHPLRKRILRAPRILAIEKKSLSMQPVRAARGLHVHPPAGRARSFRLGISSDCLNFVDRRLRHLRSTASGPPLRHSILTTAPGPIRARPGRFRPRASTSAESQPGADP